MMLSKPVLFLVDFVSVFGLSSIPQRALAAWGNEAWGTMLWGLPVAVPTLPGAGLIVLALAFSASVAWTLRKRRGIVGLPVLLAVPLVVAAGTVTVPNTFVNGTPADADQVNANFDAVEAAVNDNDTRITGAAGLVPINFASRTDAGAIDMYTDERIRLWLRDLSGRSSEIWIELFTYPGREVHVIASLNNDTREDF